MAKKKRSTAAVVGIIAAAFVVLCCSGGAIIAALGAGDPQDTAASGADPQTSPSLDGSATASPQATASPPKEKPEPPREPSGATIGTAARDGKFEFVVKKVDCGKAQVGNSFLNQKAQGQFCLVTMTVKNVGDVPQMFDSSNQRAFDGQDRRYDSDGVASTYANENNEAFLNEINPGNEVTAVVVFDIPKKTKINRLELHDSIFSGGVAVSLD